MIEEHPEETRFDHSNAMSSAPSPEADALAEDRRRDNGGADTTADDDLGARLEAAEEKAAKYQAQLTRLQADFVNFRRRMERERIEQIKFANEQLLHNLLPVVDNLERALEAGKDIESAKPLLEGVGQVLKQFLTLLEKEGVTPLDPALGQPFEPKHQEALIRAEGEAEVVVEELLRGWRYHDRVLRPTLVKVGPRPDITEGNSEAGGMANEADTIDTAGTKEVEE